MNGCPHDAQTALTVPIKTPSVHVTVGMVVIALFADRFADVVVTAAGLVVLAALEASRRVKAASANATGESTGKTGLPPVVESTRAVAAAVTELETVAVVVAAGTRAEVVGATAAPVLTGFTTGVSNRVVEPFEAVALGATPLNELALTVVST